MSDPSPELDEAVRRQWAGVLELNPIRLLRADLIDDPVELTEPGALDQERGIDCHPLMHWLADPDVDGERSKAVDDLRRRGAALLVERRRDQLPQTNPLVVGGRLRLAPDRLLQLGDLTVLGERLAQDRPFVIDALDRYLDLAVHLLQLRFECL